MSQRPAGDWAETVARAGASLEPLVRGALESLAQARWGDPASGRWRVISTTGLAHWELAQFLGMSPDGKYRYARIQVVATLDPRGKLVTWQVNNGSDFLGLTDLSPYGIQRGVVYLLDQEYRETLSPESLFNDAASVAHAAVLSFWTRLRARLGGRG